MGGAGYRVIVDSAYRPKEAGDEIAVSAWGSNYQFRNVEGGDSGKIRLDRADCLFTVHDRHGARSSQHCLKLHAQCSRDVVDLRLCRRLSREIYRRPGSVALIRSRVRFWIGKVILSPI